MDSTSYNIFKELQLKELVSPDSFMGASLPFSDFHKVGVSKGNEPMFFISCSENGNLIDINLEVFSVLFNRPCKIYENGICSEEVYTVIQLKTDNSDLQRYFINVVCLVLQQLPPTPTQKGLRVEIDKIIELFRSIANPPKQTLQGLWAELLVVEQSKNPEILVKAWHSSPEDKFDFNDGKDKLEVKSTAKNHRVHSFSIDQLSPNAGSQLIIVSIFAVQTGERDEPTAKARQTLSGKHQHRPCPCVEQYGDGQYARDLLRESAHLFARCELCLERGFSDRREIHHRSGRSKQGK